MSVDTRKHPEPLVAPDPDGTYQVEVAGHALRVFVESPPMVASLLADIAAAKKRAWIESYIFADDNVGRQVVAALAERAAAGVDVRVLYDALGSLTTRSSLFAPLLAAGGRVHAFNGFWHSLQQIRFLRSFNRRNHRKLFLTDDRVGYLGGMNIVDVGPKPAKRGDLGWRDVHLRIEGPTQPQLVESFERSWSRAQRQPVKRRPKAYRRGRMTMGPEGIRYFDSGPGLKYTRAARIFTKLLRVARQRVVVSMAYFLPTGRVLRALLRAKRQGVDITAVVPLASDVPVVDWASTFLGAKLIRRGIRIFRREKQMLHSKALIVDGQWSIVGSCNLDSRSMWYNLELMAVIRSRQMAAVLEAICQDDISKSRPLTEEELDARSWWQKLRDTLMYQLRWWL